MIHHLSPVTFRLQRAGVLFACVTVLLSGVATAQSGALPARSDIAVEDTWDLEDMYATDELWEEDFTRAEETLAGFEGFRGRLGESGATLLEALRFNNDFGMLLSDLVVYAGMRSHEDQRVDKYNGMFARALGVANRASEASSFFEPELLAIHAGLECGIIGDKFEGMEMISFGPNIHGAHSPDERIQISTCENFYRLFKALLARIAKK